MSLDRYKAAGLLFNQNFLEATGSGCSFETPIQETTR